MSKNIPLVSVIVLTYNSENYILDALNSVASQTYRRIELIISDDGSTDSTIKIVENWLDKNSSLFETTKLIVSKENTGVPANCNRGLFNSNGEWIKFLAGDDSLEKDYVDKVLKYALKNKNIKIVHGPVYAYNSKFASENFIGILIPRPIKFIKSTISANEQYKVLLNKCVVFSTSVVIHRSIFDKTGFFDEEMPVDDWPMWLRITKAGYKFFYFDEPLANYRIHSKSLTFNNKKYLFNSFLLFANEKVYRKYIRRELNFFRRTIEDLKFSLKKRIFNSKFYTYSSKWNFVYKFFSFLYRYFISIRL